MARLHRCGGSSANLTRSTLARAVELLQRGLEVAEHAGHPLYSRAAFAALAGGADRAALALLRHGA